MVTKQTILDAYQRAHPGSQRLYEESLQTFPSGVTHDIRYVSPFPIFINRAAGSRKWDVDGNEYVDYVMGHGALLLGHAHPAVTQAIVEQAAKGTHYGANHRLELEWGRWVKELVPSAEEVRFTSSGTEATLMALRLARAYTGRDRILKFDHHFHGWQDYVAGTRSPDSEHPHSPGIPDGTLANTISVPQNDLSLVEERLREDDVAAVILEPTGAAWGTLPLQEDFLAGLRELTSRHNTVLIFDEVVTGFRVSPGGVQTRYGVTPDVTTLAKILAGGLPGGAVAGKADILSLLEFRDDAGWNAGHRVAHPGTFNANPLSAAAGSTMLSLVATGEHHQHADSLNERLVLALNEVLDRPGVPGCAYGLASYFHLALGKDSPKSLDGIEWPQDAGDPPRTPGPLIAALKRGMLNHGVDLMGGSGGFTSGAHTTRDIDLTVEAFEATVGEMRAEGLV
ncbi:MAG TPA: aspartate aminotransferase family protein [Dehalococcoidia bacterium]|nr:aspartate aminotransferase family protein [Dehalococcoidia bacterium]